MKPDKINPLIQDCGLILSMLCCSLVAGCTQDGNATLKQPEMVIFAAASLSDAIREVGEHYQARHGGYLVYNFAASNTLARQIIASPKADLFLSANERWMDEVDKHGRLKPNTRRSQLSNRLSVICKTGYCPSSVKQASDLCKLMPRHLALANPKAVPAGIYAKKWLQSVDCNGQTLWHRWQPVLAPALDVRAALAMVKANSDIYGIVYYSDVLSSQQVTEFYQVPESKDLNISYSIALINTAKNHAMSNKFLAFLSTSEARRIFQNHGFIAK